jgi:hypothetical protein
VKLHLNRWGARAAWVVGFGLAFGYVEAAVVVYLREIYDPIRAQLYPDIEQGALLPLITLEQLRELGGNHLRTLGIELGREFATLLMLATIAGAARRRRFEWIAFFMLAFGVWDIAYYGGLKLMIGFPESLWTWDILFLIPVPWIGPVLAPVLVSLAMVGAALAILRQVAAGRPPRVRWTHVLSISVGALMIIGSFCVVDTTRTVGDGPLPWDPLLYSLGMAIGLTGFVCAITRTDPWGLSGQVRDWLTERKR